MPILIDVPRFESAFVVGARTSANPRFAGIEPCAGGQLLATVGEAQRFRDEVLPHRSWDLQTMETYYRTLQRPIVNGNDARIVKTVAGFDIGWLAESEFPLAKRAVDHWEREESLNRDVYSYNSFILTLREAKLGIARQFLGMRLPIPTGHLSFLESFTDRKPNYRRELAESTRIWEEEQLRLDYKAGVKIGDGEYVAEYSLGREVTVILDHGILGFDFAKKLIGPDKNRFILSGYNTLGCLFNTFEGLVYYAALNGFNVAIHIPLSAASFSTTEWRPKKFFTPEEKLRYVCRPRPNRFQEALALKLSRIRSRRDRGHTFKGYAIKLDGAFLAGAGKEATATLNWYTTVDAMFGSAELEDHLKV